MDKLSVKTILMTLVFTECPVFGEYCTLLMQKTWYSLNCTSPFVVNSQMSYL